MADKNRLRGKSRRRVARKASDDSFLEWIKGLSGVLSLVIFLLITIMKPINDTKVLFFY
ncbi:MAG TPA: hypothetical protein DDZ96_01705 [Porphyromonadaceae bacterium]|nr:hypothetical protein [Porphyromonadaceae bacterium]HBK33193.1 hypothetical protein [Porphyromonadaceae bacterium]HBL32521.1 hypothetical protein [Porphyromonadaceae bacterium]HBX20346.1 hypothetical protein [Porphyromonadaceae bacterium]HBX45983.1 hypothetical protein [Porphyromonadaceae bacterium]